MSKIKRFFRKLRSLLNFESVLQEKIDGMEEAINVVPQKVAYNMRKEYLIQQAFRCSESGVTSERYCDHEVIVSMATHGERFYEAYMAIESIMQQSIKPNRIILNVAEDEFGNKPIPPALQRQQKRGLEINYCEDYWSFKKIIPTLRRFPEAIIITVDDDCLYNPDMLENMINSYKQDPKAIWGNRIHEITLDSEKHIKSYMDWNWCIPNSDISSKYYFITSVGGVLYPPHTMYKDVCRDDIFMKICKTNDDVWCFVMALLAGTPIKKVYTHSSLGEDYFSNEEVQKSGLCMYNTNIGQHHCKNDEVIEALFREYGISKFLGYKQ